MTEANGPEMTSRVRWSVEVSRETDAAVRTLLAHRGGEKGNLSRFVEDAVNRAALREMLHDIHMRNANVDPDDLEDLIRQELEQMRVSRSGRRQS